MRVGSAFRAHLLAPLELDGALVAPAGAPVRLRILDRRTPKGEPAPQLTVQIEDFHVTGGVLPVAVEPPLFATIEPGTEIKALTLGLVERVGTRTQVRIPLPVPLGSDAPAAGFTPYPVQTPRVGATANIYAPPTRPGSPPPDVLPPPTPTPYGAPATPRPIPTV